MAAERGRRAACTQRSQRIPVTWMTSLRSRHLGRSYRPLDESKPRRRGRRPPRAGRRPRSRPGSSASRSAAEPQRLRRRPDERQQLGAELRRSCPRGRGPAPRARRRGRSGRPPSGSARRGRGRPRLRSRRRLERDRAERLEERDERAGQLHRRRLVGHPQLERPEARVRPDVPPEAPCSRAASPSDDELLDVALPLVVRGERRRRAARAGAPRGSARGSRRSPCPRRRGTASSPTAPARPAATAARTRARACTARRSACRRGRGGR